MRLKHKHARGSIIAAFSAILVFGLGLLGVTAPANAAPPYTTTGTVSSVVFNTKTVQSGGQAELTADWSIANSPKTPAGFTLPLPAELQGRNDKFDLKAPDGSIVGSCIATATELQCDLDPKYTDVNPLNLHGTVTFWARVTTTVTETKVVSYKFGSVEASVTVTPPNPAGQCTTNCEFTGLSNAKWGTGFQNENGYAIWAVQVAAPKDGMAGGEKVIIKDRPGPNLQTLKTSVDPHLMMSNEVVTTANGKQTLKWVDVPRDQYSASDNGDEVSFIAQKGYFYMVYFTTKMLDGGASVTYTNEADITIGSQKTVTVNGKSTYSGGSGTGIGTNVGMFTIAKKVAGSGSAYVSTDKSYTGSYVVTDPDGTKIEANYSVKAGDTWTSPQYARDSTVTITENVPTDPENISWGQPVFSSNDFKLLGGSTTAVTLTNTATEITGAASWTKVGPDNKVLAGSEWTLTGPDGAVVNVVDNGKGDADPAVGALKVEGLIFGQYTLKETKAPAGYILSTETKTVTVSASALSVTFGAIVNSPVVTTPPTTAPPTTPVTPTTPITPTTPPLAHTGLDSAGLAFGVLGFMALLLGGGVIFAGRKLGKH